MEFKKPRLLRVLLLSLLTVAISVTAQTPEAPKAAPAKVGPTTIQIAPAPPKTPAEPQRIENNFALILIQTSHMGPPLDPHLDAHVPTVVWPPSFTQNGSNRLLSLMTGIDWKGDDHDTAFHVWAEEPDPTKQTFASDNFEAIESRGYFIARDGYLHGATVTAVSRPTGLPAASPLELLLALDQTDHVRPTSYQNVSSQPGLLVFEAMNWEEQSVISAAVQGRTLVLELPPAKPISGPTTTPDEILGHVYFRGIGWPQGFPVSPSTGVAGLFRAREAVHLLLHPEDFTWTLDKPAHDTPAIWFEHVKGLTPTLLFTFSLVIVYVIGSAVYCIIVEHRGRLAAWVMVGIALGPADLLLSGRLDRFFGVTYWYAWLAAVIVLLGCVSGTLCHLCQKVFPDSHRLLGVGLTGLIACLLGDPTWSAMSSVFTASGNNLSAEAIGALATYLCAVVAFAQPPQTHESVVRHDQQNPEMREFRHIPAPAVAAKTPFTNAVIKATPAQSMARIIALFVLLLTASGMMWWSGDDWTYRTFPILAWLIGERLFHWPMLILWGLLPHGPTPYGGASDFWRHGAASMPMGCIPNLGSQRSVNLARYLDLLLNPGAMLFALTAGTVAVVGDRFFVRQIRMLFLRDPRIKALPWLTACLGAAGILNPIILPAAVIAGFGAMISVFYAAVSTG